MGLDLFSLMSSGVKVIHNELENPFWPVVVCIVVVQLDSVSG